MTMQSINSMLGKLNFEIVEQEYKCSNCKDTGYIFNKARGTVKECDCLKNKKRIQLPEKYRFITFDDIEINIYSNNADVERVVQRFKDITHKQMQRGLYIQGAVGRGKTFIAAAIFNKFVGKCDVRFITANELIKNIIDGFNSGNNYDIDKYKEADVLILDDIGTEKITEFAESIFFNLLNHRYNKKLPTIITSNFSIDELPSKYIYSGARIKSRLSEMCTVLSLIADDQREKRK